MLQFNRNDLERLFPANGWSLGERLAANGAVVDAEIERDGKSITGRVRGEKRTPHMTRVKITNGRGGRVRLSSTCTCMTYSECEHAVALLLSVLDKSAGGSPEDAASSVDQELEKWISHINNVVRSIPSKDTSSNLEYVLYLLEPAQRSWADQGTSVPISVSTVRARRMPNGNYGREQAVAIANLVANESASFIRLEDQIIGRLLGGVATSNRRLSSAADGETLKNMLSTGRCFWRNSESRSLAQGRARKGKFEWRFDGDGQQHVACELDANRHSADTIITALGGPWYIDPQSGECGVVRTEVPDQVAAHLLRAPAVPASAASLVRQRLLPSAETVPLPEPLRHREQVEVRPQPCLHLHCPTLTIARGMGWKREEQEVDCPLGRVMFDYAGYEVGWQDGRTELNHVADNKLLVMARDTVFEAQMIERLNGLDLQPLGPTGLGRFADETQRQDFTFEEDEDDDVGMRWVDFNHNEVPKLVLAGWRVTFDKNYPFQVARPEADWTVEVTDTETDWFDLSLDVEIDGELVPLLPVLLDLFKRSPEEMTPEALHDFGDELVYGQLPDGRLLPIPASRLKGVVDALYELFASERIDDDTVRLSRAEAARLVSLERSLPADQVRWKGGEQLRVMAQRLSEASEVPLVPPPSGLKAQLRPYQQQGLSWLQFLASCGLSGVLADDMGLGKTLQTLSHILTEKKLGRLDRPSLVIAPTSLIPTWKAEVRKFAPQLDVLVLHGNDRRELFDEIDSHDIILTSYALLIRDRDLLVGRRWRLIVMDEAQAIKNPTTKLARTAGQLRADQKLALTGTPIENHLGELWSIFNFLQPGFLGEREQFRRIFRNPIEKDGDSVRQELLTARVRPFMLRRTKEQVAAELPPKSEVLREIELTDAQRDLYETVRIAMHERVRAEIRERGIGQSSIAILEALLKLRQVCCDPRLLKKDGGGDAGSAKFDMLMEMLPNMVETGRRIIVFSQFVEMLDLIEQGLTAQEIPFVKLTGRTRDRETPVNRFQNEEVPIFLISLRAGGVGLTLTAADTVIHYDPWWNPAVEAQATDRAHRIGQSKTVFVYKLIASGTVEDKMVELQGRKKALYESVLGGGNAGLSFRDDDIEALFAPLPA